ncbi:hypothetical protein EVB32_137 [Rhizobium phage RHph_TM39]|uniref:Uncharacterized protein n=2 Tax=Cuauhnahuacvirus TaxID=3044696 RepID=A0A7S5UXP1_9CAUD|nr:hypothetical protein PQC16_gp137 [Rhizobium phage RHph_TM30]YP_010671287.1 hypothetical protein PQC17_gp138 [Rhizobium phage RHph_Y65]QIG71608.1 hypothetical protein EVB94_137 [Rhizobium phage RHph_TM40]QIG71971.1 hypothetical protein EVB95_137 [Rhizobium phage RHph_TM2_3B]QIG72333.1 hypothetical protein EVB96_137 [Rhizobium phage RHph_TM3_3_6]QIG77125.1 hypothetical protein EVB32_137 [Rhizobium phage RHph_TM39]QIG77461.1 hypothetical protein EVB61_133 [Rhizobium phage RHph_TM21B]QIG77723
MKQLDLTPEQIEFRDLLLENIYQSYPDDWKTWTIDEKVRNRCGNISPPFSKFFGLTIASGFCNDQPHFWCKDSEGNIIDPTREQFGPGPYEYEENAHD